jgi:hypothetical protein
MSVYQSKTLDGHYFKSAGFYVFFMPVSVPYKKIYAMAEAKGLKKKEAFGPILESGRLFGFGWIGIEVEKPREDRKDVIHVKGDYQMVEHKGPYKTLGQAYKKVMKECPRKKEYLNLYLDDPERVASENLRTQILFK